MFNFGLYLVLNHSILHESLFYCLLGEINISFAQEIMVQPHQNLQSSNSITLAECGPLSVNCLFELSPESESHDRNSLNGQLFCCGCVLENAYLGMDMPEVSIKAVNVFSSYLSARLTVFEWKLHTITVVPGFCQYFLHLMLPFSQK